jgi:hypothetical protein
MLGTREGCIREAPEQAQFHWVFSFYCPDKAQESDSCGGSGTPTDREIFLGRLKPDSQPRTPDSLPDKTVT